MRQTLCHASQIGGRQYLLTGLGEENASGGPDGDLKMPTDFRRVYAPMIKGWMGYDDTHAFG